MTVRTGNSGSILIGANVVAEVTAWGYDEDEKTITKPEAIGDTTEQYFSPGIKGGKGTISCNYDPDDTTGQGALTAGASVSLELDPGGTATGDPTLTGTVIIGAVNKKGNAKGLVEVSFTFVGVLTAGTHA